MHSFSLLLKPVSADCNLRCKYCFYLETCNLYAQDKKHRMQDEVLKRIIQSYLSTAQEVYSFIWQGGEPVLMGTEFFRKITDLQKIHALPGSRISNALQTNATLIRDDLARHLAHYCFLVGCSLDGPAPVHDFYRRTKKHTGSHALVQNGLNKLKKQQVEPNILTLVSQANVHNPLEIYSYLKQEGYRYQQYIPCVEFDEQGMLLPFAITGEQWGDFLCEIFDKWYANDVHTVSIRLFESILYYLIAQRRNSCAMAETCCQYLVVEYNGDVYPCDFFVTRELKLGNIMSDSWEEMLSSNLYHEFGARKKMMHPKCLECEFLNLCMGDCQKHRLKNGQNMDNLSALCSGWRQFFSYTLQRFQKLAQHIKNRAAQKV